MQDIQQLISTQQAPTMQSLDNWTIETYKVGAGEGHTATHYVRLTDL